MLQGQGIGWKLEARKSLELMLRAVNSWGGDAKVSPDLLSRARKRIDQETRMLAEARLVTGTDEQGGG